MKLKSFITEEGYLWRKLGSLPENSYKRLFINTHNNLKHKPKQHCNTIFIHAESALCNPDVSKGDSNSPTHNN